MRMYQLHIFLFTNWMKPLTRMHIIPLSALTLFLLIYGFGALLQLFNEHLHTRKTAYVSYTGLFNFVFLTFYCTTLLKRGG